MGPFSVLREFSDQARRAGFAPQLLERALSGRLIRPPAYQAGAVAEAVRGYLVELNLHHEIGPERLPLASLVRAPSAGATWRFSGKAWRFDKGLGPRRQVPPLLCREA